ncbi:hypothetical protein KSF_104530 [Reticulibacter mediterranei]|uniref:ABC3 transporter permease C-terminal domain-containing protein n=1 Tax=Reticulibacter mediterranei TaxID=2778369 RepID=A0A8J3N9B2_9CHLR|nr:ABC transporter permease [Reticulibacter mediterranei]GHP00406.1 hypothetical protein KSF_104530 [Reticulibacter mediterranei]
MLALAGAIFISGLNTSAGIEAIPDTLAAEQRWDVEVALDAPVSATRLESVVARIPHVTHVETWTSEPAALQSSGQVDVTTTYPDQGHGSLNVTTVPETSSVFVPPPVLEGRWLRSDDTNAMVLPQMMKNLLQGRRVGEATIQLAVGGKRTTWRVVGIVEELFAPTCPCVSRAGFDQVTGRTGQANIIRIVTDSHDAQTRMALGQMVRQTLTNAAIKVRYVRPLDWLTAVSTGHLSVLVVVFLLMASVMGVVGLIGLGSTMSTNVLERTREFGVMRAIGAPASIVRRVVVAEGVFTAALSCVVAVVVALLLTRVMDVGLGNLFLGAPLPFRFSTSALLVWAVAIVLGAILTTLAPGLSNSQRGGEKEEFFL